MFHSKDQITLPLCDLANSWMHALLRSMKIVSADANLRYAYE